MTRLRKSRFIFWTTHDVELSSGGWISIPVGISIDGTGPQVLIGKWSHPSEYGADIRDMFPHIARSAAQALVEQRRQLSETVLKGLPKNIRFFEAVSTPQGPDQLIEVDVQWKVGDECASWKAFAAETVGRNTIDSERSVILKPFRGESNQSDGVSDNDSKEQPSNAKGPAGITGRDHRV